MKILSFDYDEKDELVIVCDNKGLVEELMAIPSMFDKKAKLTYHGWFNTKIDGIRCWYYPETISEALEVMVSLHNFFYYQSDNIDTFNRGDKYLKTLEQRLEDNLSIVEAVALWNKYAPKELQKNV
jgi:hypothetical protein